jgi:hypothetical protein
MTGDATARLKELLDHGRWEIATEIVATMKTSHFDKPAALAAARELRIERAQCPRPGTPAPDPIHPTAPGADAVRRAAWKQGKVLWRFPVPLHAVQPYPDNQRHGSGPVPVSDQFGRGWF